jgi:TetR/AcrR family transcriptional regulator
LTARSDEDYVPAGTPGGPLIAETAVRANGDGDAIRQRILDAAERVFAERGYAAAATREIAEGAGIRKRMLFYYFSSKDALYRAVLERLVGGMAAIHERFRNEPGPIGLGDAIDGIIAFTAANLDGLKILVREIMDAGPHLPALAREHLAPLFAQGGTEVARNMREGIFRTGDPMHVIMNVGGLTLWYFLMVPLLDLVWDRKPLDPEVLAERAAAVRELMMSGLAGPAVRGGKP